MYNTVLFRGTDRLKSTANEQDLIRGAERAQGYRREEPTGNHLVRMLVRLLVWTLGAMFLAFFFVAVIGVSYGALSLALGVLVQEPAAEVSVSPPAKDGRARTIPDRQGMDHQPVSNAETEPAASPPEVEVVAGTFEEQKQESQTTDPESSLRGQTPEQVEGERRVEFATMKQAVATMKERGHIDEFVGHIQRARLDGSRS